jgi:NDP-sugar pyrophosphorylase family protein
MSEPILVIMAAGMGNRYGGLKQIEPMTEAGEIIIDFSLYDAMLAGFKKAVFIIKREMEDDMRRLIDARSGRQIETEFVFQDMNNLPDGLTVPEGRLKPLGTSHAIWCARNAVDAPFAVINADDYYGPEAFRMIYGYLKTVNAREAKYAMVSYALGNTLSDSGSVTRGVCEVGSDGMLLSVRECKKISRINGAIEYAGESGVEQLSETCPVSMNFWGLTPVVFEQLDKLFPDFVNGELSRDPLSAEYLLPTTIDRLLRNGDVTVRALPCSAKWHGITYQEDKPRVRDALSALKSVGAYPARVWG